MTNTNTESTFTTTLKTLLKINGITSRQLARALNIHPVTISNWLTGKSFPSAKSLHALSSYFSVPTNAFYDGLHTSPPSYDAFCRLLAKENISVEDIITAIKKLTLKTDD